MSDVEIKTTEVYDELNKIDQAIEALNQLYNNVNPDISGGWDSEISKTLIRPKIQKMKDDITEISGCVAHVREAVGTYTRGIEKADAAGTTAEIK